MEDDNRDILKDIPLESRLKMEEGSLKARGLSEEKRQVYMGIAYMVSALIKATPQGEIIARSEGFLSGMASAARILEGFEGKITPKDLEEVALLYAQTVGFTEQKPKKEDLG